MRGNDRRVATLRLTKPNRPSLATMKTPPGFTVGKRIHPTFAAWAALASAVSPKAC